MARLWRPVVLFSATSCLVVAGPTLDPGSASYRSSTSQYGATLSKRSDSPVDVCTRWAHQSALVNGSLYIYGGSATTEPDQTQNTWNNNFLSLDLTTSWQISIPPLTGLPQISALPNISLGALWNSYDALYMYGGEFSSAPSVDPAPLELWQYTISSAKWSSSTNLTTIGGINSGPGDEPVQRSAEGASISVPSLGKAWYFGGHQDMYTTQGWSLSVARVYLQSLLEYTFPSVSNSADKPSPDGLWRNITQGGLQTTAGFPERADGLLLYVPGFGTQGILLGLAGGTNDTFQQMNEVDVFDIDTSTFYKQATSGPSPGPRVNPCGVVAAAPDGSSYNVYMYAGQTLQPAGNQTQFDDLWILTVPSFTWIKVDQSGQSKPYARAGHTCNIWNGQMIVVGGYTGTQLSCDSPGIYVFDLSTLKWVEKYTVPSTTAGNNFVSDAKTNPLNQQPAQLANASNPGGLEGSFGYLVPSPIVAVVGGSATGGANVTSPAQTVTSGPLATGHPLTWSGGSSDGTSNGSVQGNGKMFNTGAMVAGIIAGLLFILVLYLAFCAWLYRKRVTQYKRHMDMAHDLGHTSHQGYGDEKTPFSARVAGGRGTGDARMSSERDAAMRYGSGSASGGRSSTNSAGAYDGGWTSAEAHNSLHDDDEPYNLFRSEPTFWGTMLAPRRSLRVVNRD